MIKHHTNRHAHVIFFLSKVRNIFSIAAKIPSDMIRPEANCIDDIISFVNLHTLEWHFSSLFFKFQSRKQCILISNLCFLWYYQNYYMKMVGKIESLFVDICLTNCLNMVRERGSLNGGQRSCQGDTLNMKDK